MITNVTRHKLREMAGIQVYFIILGILGIYFISNGKDFPLLRGIISILLFGIFTSVYEIIILPKIKKLPFLIVFISTSLFYYVTFSSIVAFMGYATLVFKKGMTWEAAFTVKFTQVFPMGLGLPLFFLFMAIILLSAIRFANIMIGKSVIKDYLSGKYHRPRSEERIFMFLDLRSSTRIAEILGHELYSSFLKDLFNRLDEVILETEANLFQYVGDEIVMVWKYKHGFKNNNCIKFFRMIEELIEQNKNEFLNKYNIVPEYKAGIHCGTVSITEIGSIRKSIAYHGDPINTAARICSKCKELDEKLLISENVFMNLSKNSKNGFLDLGQHELRGKTQKLNLFSIN